MPEDVGGFFPLSSLRLKMVMEYRSDIEIQVEIKYTYYNDRITVGRLSNSNPRNMYPWVRCVVRSSYMCCVSFYSYDNYKLLHIYIFVCSYS